MMIKTIEEAYMIQFDRVRKVSSRHFSSEGCLEMTRFCNKNTKLQYVTKGCLIKLQTYHMHSPNKGALRRAGGQLTSRRCTYMINRA